MDAPTTPHPTPQTLQAYGLGMLDDASAEAVNKHLEECVDCRRQVAEIAPDSFLGRLREVQERPGAPASGRATPGATQTELGRTAEAPAAAPKSFAAGPGATDAPTIGLPPHTSSPRPETTVADDATVDRPSIPCMSSTDHAGTTSAALNSPNGPSLQPGTYVGYFGDYELQRVLGEGGMGIVYKARQLSLNRPVALKMIKAARFATDDDRRRFQNEAEAVARLDHPNIVPVFEVGQFEDQHYFSMKLIAGESLDKRLKDYLADPRRAAKLLAVTAGAIHHAHQRGILHRDLKPANILVDSEGQPHVTDFGLAKRVEGDSELTRSGAVVGTPAYMAPEQTSAKKGAVTTATDVHGLGAVLYALLTGRGPFGGTTLLDTLDQVRDRAPEPPRRLNPRVPRDLEVICLKCLEKDPRRRYASADAVAEDLKHWLAGEPIVARPVGNAARLWMWCRRNPFVAGAAGLVATALVVVAVLSLLYADEQNRRAGEQVEATRKIGGLNKNLEKERQDLKISLSDSNRRLAMLHFERARRAFDSGQANIGLLCLVETWRYALKADDRAWQHLARANLSFWRYHSPEVKGIFSHYVAWSPDGKTILTQSERDTARLWDVATNRPIGQPMVHQGSINSMAFSPDGKTVLTGSQDESARLWDAASGRPIGKPMVHQDPIRSVAFSPDGRTILTTFEGAARLWDATTGQPIGHAIIAQGRLILSPNGKTILTSGFRDNTARLWDAAIGQASGPAMVHQGAVTSMAYSPDGETVVTGSQDKTARLWDAGTAKPIGKPLVHPERVFLVAFNPDGKTILTASVDGTARLWEAVSAKPIGQVLQYERDTLPITVEFSPNGKNVLFWNPQSKLAWLWDAATGQAVGPPLAHQRTVRAVAFSPDGNTVLTGSLDTAARLWDAASGRPIGRVMVHQGEIFDVAFSPDGKAILTNSGVSSALWDPVTELPLGQPLDSHGRVGSAAFSPDGKRVITIEKSTNTPIRLWDAASGKAIGPPLAQQGEVRAVAFSLDGKTVLTGSADKTARLWDVASGQPIGQPLTHQGRVLAVAFSPDGKTILTGSSDNTARLWDVASGRATGSTLTHQSGVLAVAFSPNGKVILTGSEDWTARLWDASSGQPIGKPLEHRDYVWAIAFSPDGKAVLTGSSDKTARLWDAASGQPIGHPMVHKGRVDFVAFSSDGKTLVTGANAVVKLWDAATTQAIGQPKMSLGVGVSRAISPVGKTILTLSADNKMRLWDAATGQPVGPLLEHEGLVTSVLFSPNGQTIFSACQDNTTVGGWDAHTSARLWHLPALVDNDLPRIEAWVETITGLALDDEGNITDLDGDAWRERRKRLYELGGPPMTNHTWLFDPILYGADPSARARAWTERKRWVEAEAAFAEVIRARPTWSSAWIERGRYYVLRSQPEKAAADFVQALALGDRDPKLLAEIVASEAIFDLVLALLPGDATAISIELLFERADHLAKEGEFDLARAVLARLGTRPWEEAKLSTWSLQPGEMFATLGCSAQVSALLSKYQQTTDPNKANDVAWCCALAPGAVADPEAPVRLAEIALKDFPAEQKHLVLNTLGAALYRAGRFEDAIRRLEEGIQLRHGTEEPLDWPFLAMAHHRLGHRDEARRWLSRLRNRQSNTDPFQFWEELEIRLLRSEAEAVILYDPIFPANPFGH